MNTPDTYTLDAFASLEAESALIGALLLDNRAFDLISDTLRPEHFSGGGLREIYAEIARQLTAGKGCDMLTVHDAMQGQASLVQLAQLAQYVPSAANTRRYAEIVIERNKSRALLAVSGEIHDLAHDHAQAIDDRVQQAQAQLAKLVGDAPDDEFVSAYDGMLAHTNILEQRQAGTVTAWPTGLDDLDDYLEGGLRPGELVIVGARPSMGKTALGLTIGVRMAEKHGVALLSMEMSHMEVNDRLTAMLGNVSMSSVKRPQRGDGLDWGRTLEGVERARSLRLYTSDKGGLNINQVRSKARNLKRLHNIDVLVVDYIGLMTGLDARANRNTQLEEISRGLKTLAKELNICVLCLAQLNRRAEERADAMPQMSDLRDSGAIEQDADVILFIKRPIMANPDLGEQWNHYARLSIAKNRQGRCGALDLSYIGEQTRFSGWSGPAPSKSAFSSGRSNSRGMD